MILQIVKMRLPVSVIIIFCSLIFSCEPLVTKFEDIEKAEFYKAKNLSGVVSDADTLVFMTWNIRFGAGRIRWFGDCCGDRVILTENEVYENLERLTQKIDEIKPDIIFLQEVDVESKRTGYIDQVQWLLDHTYFNYGAYASMWQAQVVPSDGLGRVNTGNAILSRWKIIDAERIQLPLREDQDALTQYFYLRRNILKTEIEVPGLSEFYAINIHMSAFCTDDTKQRQIVRLLDELDNLKDAAFVLGGDFNLIPPGSDSVDFCDEDRCPGESFHGANDDPYHKEGSYFGDEVTLMQTLYDEYKPALPLSRYQNNQDKYFTHSTDEAGLWDRKLDYLFSNYEWVDNSDSTHQEARSLSDHAPVTAKWRIPK